MRQFPRIEMCPSAVKPNRPGCVISGTVNIDRQWWGRGRINKWGAIERGECLYFLIGGGGTLCGEAHHVSSLLPAEAYSRGGRVEKAGGELWRQKSTRRVRTVFYVPSKLTLLLTFNFLNLLKTTQRQKQTLFHSIIDDVFVVFLNVQS